MSNDQKTPARRPFRYLAAGVAVFCFLAAIAFRWFGGEDWLIPVIICGFVCFMMAGIAVTGNWPPKR